MMYMKVLPKKQKINNLDTAINIIDIEKNF